MRKIFFVLSLLLLGFSKSFGQEGISSVNLIRSGLGFTHTGTHVRFDISPGQNVQNLFLLPPSFVHVANHLYVSASLPSIGWYKNDDYKSAVLGINPSFGYAFGKADSRLRPFVAGVLNFQMSYLRFTYPAQIGQGGYVYSGEKDVTRWFTNTWIELRLGAFYRLSDRIWADLSLEAPTGHALYYARTSSGQDFAHDAFANVYDTYLPKVQLGVSYQIR